MGYRGIVKDNVIVLGQAVKLPEGTEVQVVPQGWWMSEEAMRNAIDKKASRKLLAECDKLREQRPETADTVKIIREMREERASR